MESVAHSARRKACDYCVSRKIKCDGRKPTCSNCTLYGVTCKITATTRRRAVQRSNSNGPASAAASAPAPAPAAEPGRIDMLEQRLANIEALLTMLTGGSKPPASEPVPEPSVPYSDINLDDMGIPTLTGNWPCPTPPTANESADTPLLYMTEPVPQTAPTYAPSQLELAPLSEILPIVDNFFRNYNKLIPVFDETTFMRMLLDWYSLSNARSVVSWAAINAVVAISHRVLDGRSMDDPTVAQCLRNVQSVMNDLMKHDQDLLGLQVLLAMVILYQGSSEFQVAIMMMASVIRIVHSFRLHSKQAMQGLSTQETLQRYRIFWIAYIYDRELALRARSPYYQLDSETDLDVPSLDPVDGLGMICSNTDTVQLNWLRLRAQLAYLQGRVNDLLYSQKTSKLTQDQKSNAVSRIEAKLIEWQRSIPDELQHAEGIKQRLSPVAMQLMINMYYRHFECLIKIHSIFSFDDEWINRVNRYLSPAVIEVKDDEVDGEIVRSGLSPLPTGWTMCVQRGRLCLDLLTMRRQTEYTIWLHTCGSYSCLILLIVNMIEFPDNDLVPADRKLIDNCRGVFEDMSMVLPKNPFNTLLNVARELDRRAQGQVHRALQTKTDFMGGDVGFSPSTAFSILDDMDL